MTSQLAFGVDLGGTKVEVAIVDEKGVIRHRILSPTQTEAGPESIVESISKTAKKIAADLNCQPNTLGIGIAGQIDRHSQSVLFAPNLRWSNFPLKQALENQLQIPVEVINDVRAAAWGEWQFGAGRGYNDLICVFVGTGIGGGIVSNGQMLVGGNNSAGEVGHMIIDWQGPDCTCGSYGCLEAFAGGWAIGRRAREAVGADLDEGKHILDLAGGSIENITAKTVIEATHAGDPFANLIVSEVLQALIAGTTSLANAFNPELIVFGGGIINGMPSLIGKIEEGVRKRALHSATAHLKIIQAQLTADAGVVGAAAYARSQLK